jgi:hypothetical protein
MHFEFTGANRATEPGAFSRTRYRSPVKRSVDAPFQSIFLNIFLGQDRLFVGAQELGFIYI